MTNGNLWWKTQVDEMFVAGCVTAIDIFAIVYKVPNLKDVLTYSITGLVAYLAVGKIVKNK